MTYKSTFPLQCIVSGTYEAVFGEEDFSISSALFYFTGLSSRAYSLYIILKITNFFISSLFLQLLLETHTKAMSKVLIQASWFRIYI